MKILFAPIITLPEPSLSYNANDPATLIDASATLSDLDSYDFDNGVLTIDFSSNGHADDRLTIRHQGTGSGQIGISGNTISYAGITIGTFSGGLGLTTLEITFNANSSIESARALIRNTMFFNISDTPTENVRTVRFVMSDGDGGTSEAVTKDIEVINPNAGESSTPIAPPSSIIVDTTRTTDNNEHFITTILNKINRFFYKESSYFFSKVKDYAYGDSEQRLVSKSNIEKTGAHLKHSLDHGFNKARPFEDSPVKPPSEHPIDPILVQDSNKYYFTATMPIIYQHASYRMIDDDSGGVYHLLKERVAASGPYAFSTTSTFDYLDVPYELYDSSQQPIKIAFDKAFHEDTRETLNPVGDKKDAYSAYQDNPVSDELAIDFQQKSNEEVPKKKSYVNLSQQLMDLKNNEQDLHEAPLILIPQD